MLGGSVDRQRRSVAAEIPRFVVIGGIGFIVDAGVLTALASGAGLDLYVSRLLSFTAATAVTWALNRGFTFASTNPRRGQEYLRYVTVQIVGALINLGVFVLLIQRCAWMADVPALPLAAGSIVAMVFNFVGARYLVFAERR
jgi:putative flippase GtrA